MHPTIEFTQSDLGRIEVVFTLVREHDSEVYLDGTLVPYHSGRAVEHSFEIGWVDPHSADGEYWDDHWEQIEEDILKAFYNQKQAI